MHEVKFIVVASHTPAAMRRHPTARQRPPLEALWRAIGVGRQHKAH
jgi:hypothetical protein